MGIGGQNILIEQTIPAPMDTLPPLHFKDQGKGPLSPFRDMGVMKLVTVKGLPGGEIRIGRINFKDRVPVTLRALVQNKAERKHPGHRKCFVFHKELFPQIHQASALRINGKPRLHGFAE